MFPDVLEISLSLNKLSAQAVYYWALSEVWLWEAITDWANLLDHEIDVLFYTSPILSDPDHNSSSNSAGTPEGDHGAARQSSMRLWHI